MYGKRSFFLAEMLILIMAGSAAANLARGLVVEPQLGVHNINTGLDYGTIQEAINAPETLDGHTIEVDSPRSCEHVVVNKTVQLKRVPPDAYAVIDGNGTSGSVVTITADNVVVSGFRIVNSGSQLEDAGILLDKCQGAIIERNVLMNNNIGISLVDSDNNTLKSNSIDDCEYYSINLANSHNNVIRHNNMNKHGIHLLESNSNRLSGNRVFSAECGVSLKGNHNKIADNRFEGNTIGINLQGNHSTIVRNKVMSNLQYGITLSGRDNVIYHNSLVNNAKQVWTDSINSWDDGYASGGNYWSDHPSPDWHSGPNQDILGSDGIGDSPYVIDGYNLDRYPLMMWPPPLIILSLYPPATTVTLGQTFRVNITVTDIFISETPVLNGLFGWEAWMTFDPNVLRAANATEGPFLKSAGHDTAWSSSINNTEGYLRVGAIISMPPVPPTGAIGSGVLATLTFVVVSEGATSLHFETSTQRALTNLYMVVADDLIKIGNLVPVFVVDGVVTVQESPPVLSDLDIVPKTLNMRSRGKWITAYVELPEGYDVSDINISTVMLNDAIPVSLLDVPAPEPVPTEIGDCDSDGVLDLMVKFNRTELTSHIYHALGMKYGNVTLTVVGELADGTMFESSDVIRVIFGGDVNNDGFVNVFDLLEVRNVLGTPKEDFGYTSDADLNLDGFVNMNDLAIARLNIGAAVP